MPAGQPKYVTHSIKLHQLGAELDDEKLYQVGKEFPLPFALVPWRHHVEIITKCDTIEKALFYIGKTIELGLSRDALINCINAKLYETQDKIVNNFSEHMPELQSKLIQEVMKENYDFGFATYNNIRIKDMLPTQEQLKERMELLKKELKHTKRLMKKNSP